MHAPDVLAAAHGGKRELGEQEDACSASLATLCWLYNKPDLLELLYQGTTRRWNVDIVLDGWHQGHLHHRGFLVSWARLLQHLGIPRRAASCGVPSERHPPIRGHRRGREDRRYEPAWFWLCGQLA